jgi:Arc/MetJ family transcription regulator
MAKHLVDLDEAALTAAQAELGTDTIKDTVNAALRRAGRDRQDRVKQSLAVLATAKLTDRADAWRSPISSTRAS